MDHEGCPTARRNRIHHNVAGIAVYDGSSGLFENNDVYAQKITGILIDDANGTFRKNRIRKCTRFAVSIQGTSEPLFEDNEISESGLSVGGANVNVSDGANPVLRGNTIQGGAIGMVFHARAQGVAEGNEIDSAARMGYSCKRTRCPSCVKIESMMDLGGGIAAQPKTKGIFERNRMIDNKKWGFMVAQQADPTLRDNLAQGSPFGIVVCEAGRGTFIGNDVRGNERLGLHIDATSTPVRCEGNVSDDGAAAKPGPSKGLLRGNGGKKGRGK